MKHLADQIKQALSALAYGDIGERVGRREQYAALFPEVSTPEPMPSLPRKWIALGVGTSGNRAAYCSRRPTRRMRADLLLLSVDAMRVRSLLADYLPDLHGIECQTEELSSTAAAAVLHALNLHRGVLFAVSSANDDPLRPLLRARRGLRSPVPMVLVSPKSPNLQAASHMRVAPLVAPS